MHLVGCVFETPALSRSQGRAEELIIMYSQKLGYNKQLGTGYIVY
jgi:hypothetical protein